MKLKVFIDLSKYSLEDSLFNKMNLLWDDDDNVCGVVLNIDSTENYVDILTNPVYQQEMLDVCLEDIVKNNMIFMKNKYIMLKVALEKDSNFLLKAEWIELSGKLEEIKRYIEKYPEILCKKVHLSHFFGLNREDLNELIEIFGYNENIEVMIDGNEAPITIVEFEKTLNMIEDIVAKVKCHSFTPFESLIYAYDLVRDRNYLRESIDEDYSESRDLTRVLLGDKIVCLGFAKIFEAVANKLGINTKVFLLISKEKYSGHARCLSYIKDDEYGIDGLYFFDPSHGSKRAGFLESYLFCARTKDQIEKFDKGAFYYESYPFFDEELLMNFVEDLEETGKTAIEALRIMGSSKFNYMQRLLGEPRSEKFYFKDGNDIEEALFNIKDKSEEPIKYEKFIKALYKVRKIQYYENPTKFAFDINVLADILVKSKISVVDTFEDKIMAAIFGEAKVVDRASSKGRVEKYLKDNGLDRDMANVKLTRILKTLAISREDEEFKLSKKI